MKVSFQKALGDSVAAALRDAVRREVLMHHIHIPAKRDAVGSPIAISYALDADKIAESLTPDRFLPVLGVLPVARVRAENGWLLFTLTDALYDAAIDAVRDALQKPTSDCESYALNRMLSLARHDGTTCPKDAVAQRAWLLTLLLLDDARPAAIARAEEALLTMQHHLMPRERLDGFGALADAASRILYSVYERN